ncbi:MAG: hypothetical protein R2844_07705 [Caldilineales bacterium]
MNLEIIRRPLADKSWPIYLRLALVYVALRMASLFWWLLDPGRWQLAFRGSVILPLSAVLVFPWTTLVYVFIAAPDRLSDQHWIWLGVALLLDLLMYDRGIWRSRAAEKAC